MIHPIELQIDTIETYAIIGNEISINMGFPECEARYLNQNQIVALSEIQVSNTGTNVHRIMNRTLSNEVNFYKLLIKRLHTVI